MEKLPTLSVDLVAELDRLYPERCPDPNQSNREIWMEVGARNLVRYLLEKVRQSAEENILEI